MTLPFPRPTRTFPLDLTCLPPGKRDGLGGAPKKSQIGGLAHHPWVIKQPTTAQESSNSVFLSCLHHIPTAPTQPLRFSSNLPCHAQSSPIGQPFVLALEAHVFGNPCQGKPGAISTFDSVVVPTFVSGSRRKQVSLPNQFFLGGRRVKEVVL